MRGKGNWRIRVKGQTEGETNIIKTEQLFKRGQKQERTETDSVGEGA